MYHVHDLPQATSTKKKKTRSGKYFQSVVLKSGQDTKKLSLILYPSYMLEMNICVNVAAMDLFAIMYWSSRICIEFTDIEIPTM